MYHPCDDREFIDDECFEECMKKWGNDEVCEEECTHIMYMC